MVVKKSCKVCGIEKERNYFELNTQGRAIFKDEFGNLWHGLKCHSCHLNYVKNQSTSNHLQTINCLVCQSSFLQKHIIQKYCSRKCQRRGNK